MADLSELLPQVARNYVDHPVVDKTGIAGSYDFPLDWMGKAAYLAAKANPDGPVAVSMFDAIEKLGLKLEPGKSPASVIVIDRSQPHSGGCRERRRKESPYSQQRSKRPKSAKPSPE